LSNVRDLLTAEDHPVGVGLQLVALLQLGNLEDGGGLVVVYVTQVLPCGRRIRVRPAEVYRRRGSDGQGGDAGEEYYQVIDGFDVGHIDQQLGGVHGHKIRLRQASRDNQTK